MHKWVCTLILFVLNQDYVPPKHNLTLTTDVVYLDYEWSWNLYLERYLTAMADFDFKNTFFGPIFGKVLACRFIYVSLTHSCKPLSDILTFEPLPVVTLKPYI